jgi:type VI protein secretion system component VasK
MPPRRNTRPADNPHPLPRPGFQTVLNSLLAQRDAALGVTIPSQPIARWESSSQPEILWELLAEQRRAGIAPSLSQEQNAAVEAAIAHIPPP